MNVMDSIYGLIGLPVLTVIALVMAFFLRKWPLRPATLSICVVGAATMYRASAPYFALNTEIDLCGDTTSVRYVGSTHPDCLEARRQTESYRE